MSNDFIILVVIMAVVFAIVLWDMHNQDKQ